MKVSLEWLRELVNVEETADNLAERLTRGGIEVGGVESTNPELEQIVVGEIMDMAKHHDAEKLWVCQVDVGAKTLGIVTGASNLQVGDRVPVALIGTTLPNGVHIQESKLRGVVSEGMLCSTEELLLDSNIGAERSQGGILILPVDASGGQKLSECLGLADSVLDLELYPNRPDCLAMVNVAREVSSLTGAEVRLSKWADVAYKPDLPEAQDMDIIIEEQDLCWRYAGLLVEDVRIQPSPEWMQRRLRAAGVRPINNIVDITNYCMLEMGQPLHAFDKDKIIGNVHVRRAYPGEKLATLDGIERELDSEMLLIADDKQPLALAGVMGGLDSEVTEATTSLLIESAHFSQVSIRRTSRKLGLRSEASNRFEKGVNPYGVLATLGRVSELLSELGAGRPTFIKDNTSYLPPARQITLSAKRVNEVLGVKLPKEDIRWVLTRLMFGFEDAEGLFVVNIPSYRPDLQIEEDLIEEVARLIGYDRIPTTLAQGAQTQGIRTPEQEFRRRMRHTLIRVGMTEVMTYSFARAEVDEKFGCPDRSISLLNPLREELRVMRTSLIPGLLEVATRNVARRNTDFSLFEIGNIYLANEQPLRTLPEEERRVAGIALGKSKRHWLKQVVNYDFYYVKGILEEVAREFGLAFSFRVPTHQDLLHPGRSVEIYVGGSKTGIMGEVHPALGKEWGLEGAVIFDLNSSLLFENIGGTIRVQPIPRFPAVQRDLAVVVSREIPVDTVVARIGELGGELLQQVEVFDVYTGKPIPEDRQSLAFTLRYQSLERTLTDDEVNRLNSRILEGIQQEFAAEWRK